MVWGVGLEGIYAKIKLQCAIKNEIGCMEKKI